MLAWQGEPDVVPAGLYEGRVVETLGGEHQEDVCGGLHGGCSAEGHSWYFVRLLLPKCMQVRTWGSMRQQILLDHKCYVTKQQ